MSHHHNSKDDDNNDDVISERVRVYCRTRPSLSHTSSSSSSSSSSHLEIGKNQILVRTSTSSSSKTEQKKTYRFDQTPPSSINNLEMFQLAAEPIISNSLQGYNGTIFAYGQTGSGKTHTMFGTDSEEGIVPLTLRRIFSASKSSSSSQIQLNISYVQIYCETIQDLLDPSNNTQIFVRESERTPVLEGVRHLYIHILLVRFSLHYNETSHIKKTKNSYLPSSSHNRPQEKA